MLIARSDRSKKAIWFWTIDRWLFSSFLILMCFGALFIMAASPKIAVNLNLDLHFFTIRHIIFLFLGFFIILFFSQMNEKVIKLIAILGIITFLILMSFTLLDGVSTKGAKRWIYLFGQSIQPSEFIKPFFVVVNAWLLHLWKKNENFKGWLWSFSLLSILVLLLLLQPDLGMTVLFISVWIIQIFLSGVSLLIFLILFCSLPIIIFFSYFYFDHVNYRINMFFEGNSFQTLQAIKSFQTGSYFGKGIGEGFYKNNLPDAHTDFIFAVIAEEFGIIICCIILILYGIFVFRSLSLAMRGSTMFYVLAISGLSFLFGLQCIIHISSNLGLIPTKGMTLPFLSYGGSSTISSALIVGIIISLTRKQINLNHFQNNVNEAKIKNE